MVVAQRQLPDRPENWGIAQTEAAAAAATAKPWM